MIETMSFLYFLFLAKKKKKNGAGNIVRWPRGHWHGLAHGRLGSRQRWLSAMKDVAFLRQVRRVAVKERTYFCRKEIRTCFFRLLKKVIYKKKAPLASGHCVVSVTPLLFFFFIAKHRIMMAWQRKGTKNNDQGSCDNLRNRMMRTTGKY